MSENEHKSKLARIVDRRAFLKACGALGVGAVAGGVIQAKWDVVGLTRRLKKVSHTRLAMGTYVTITAVHESRDLAQDAIGRAFDEMERLIAIFTRFESASPLSVLNRDGRLPGAPREMTDVLRWARHFNELSWGAFDVTVKPLIDLLDETAGPDGPGFPSEAQIADALERVDAKSVAVTSNSVYFQRAGMGITLDGIAKGFIVDAMSASLDASGVHNHLVNAGGDIRTRGATVTGKPWRIAVEDPEKKQNYPDVIQMTDGAVATSGNYEIYYDDKKVFHHIFDPRNGVSPQHSTSVTVRTSSVMTADALSTAVFVADPQAGLRMLDSAGRAYGGQCLILGADGRRYSSAGWKSARA